MNKKISINTRNIRQNFFSILCIYILIFISSGYQMNAVSGTKRILIFLVLIVFIFFIKYKNLKLYQKPLIVFFVIIICILLTTIIKEDEIKQFLITTAMISTAFAYSIAFSLDDYIENFIKVMYFLSIFSLIMLIAWYITPELVKMLPIVYNINEIPAYNGFFSTISAVSSYKRNQGIFWEPGAYQTFINLALMFELFKGSKKINHKVIIFCITILTTYSSTGYILCISLLSTYILSTNYMNRSKINKRKLALMTLMLLLIGMIIYSSLSYELQYQLFGKVANYFEQDNDTVTSTSIRIDSIIKVSSQFLIYPIFGNGLNGIKSFALEEGFLITTCTFINWFAYYGIFIGLIMNFGLLKLSSYMHKKLIIKFCLFICILISIISEDYYRNPSIIVFIMLMYNRRKINYQGDLL